MACVPCQRSSEAGVISASQLCEAASQTRRAPCPFPLSRSPRLLPGNGCRLQLSNHILITHDQSALIQFRDVWQARANVIKTDIRTLYMK